MESHGTVRALSRSESPVCKAASALLSTPSHEQIVTTMQLDTPVMDDFYAELHPTSK